MTLFFDGTDADTLDGGAGDDTIHGGGNPVTSTGGNTTASDTFKLIRLGQFEDIDTDESNITNEDEADLLGTYGGIGSELYNNFLTAVTDDANTDTALQSNDNGQTLETITIDGQDRFIVSTTVFSATVTFTDGTTGSFTAVFIQTTNGEVFLAPESTKNADNILLTSKPIRSISLDSVDSDSHTGMAADRVDPDYGLRGDSDTSGDSIDGGDGNDEIHGGAGSDIIADFNAGNTSTLNDGDATNNDSVDLSGSYHHISELYADQADDGILNQSNATDTRGNATDYSDNSQFGSGSLRIDGATADKSSFTQENTGVVCFTSGTAIRPPRGDELIEDLAIGDLVTTLDNGPQPICGIGRRTLGKGRGTGQSQLAPGLDQARCFGG